MKETKTSKYLIYARVSPKGSTWASSESSIDMQIQACKRFIGGESCEIIKDEFYTAKDNNRPGLQQILEDLNSGRAEWDALIVYKLDRLTRSLLDGGQIFELLRNNNKGFISVTENLDFSSPMGRAMLGIINIFAQLEREQLAERTRDKMMSIAASGEYAPGICPYGYKRAAPHSNVLAIDDRKAEHVRDMYQSYLSGQSTDDIHKKYKDILSKNQIIWILKNKHYIGQITYGGKEFKGKHVPIIDTETFARVQAHFPNKEYKSRPAAQRYPYLLAGLLFCHCGKRLTPAGAKNNTFFYYKCTNHLCKTKVSAPKLEKAILEFIENYELNSKQIELVCKKIQEKKKKCLAGNAPELNQITSAIQQVKKDIDTTAMAFLSQKNKDFWDDKLFTLREELNRLEARKIEVSSIADMDLGVFEDARTLLQHMKRIKEHLEKNPDDIELRRQAVTSYIKQVKFSCKDEYLLYLADGTTKRHEWLPRQDLNLD